MSTQIKELSDELLPLFEQYLKRNEFRNACILRDIYNPNLRKRCEFYLTIHNGSIAAALTTYHNPNPAYPPSIWLLGVPKFTSQLCSVIHEDKVVIHTTSENAIVVKKKFPNAVSYTADVMVIQKGDEKLTSKHTVKRIEPGEYIEERILLAGETPDDKTVALRRKLDEEKTDAYTYLGFADNIAVSTTSIIYIVDNLWHIGWTYTKSDYRRQGYAISTLSRALQDAFDAFHGQHATLFVLGHNEPAKTLYRKIGFKKNRRNDLVGA